METNEKDCSCQESKKIIPFGWIPSGSVVVYNPDNTITITPPANWSYVGIV